MAYALIAAVLVLFATTTTFMILYFKTKHVLDTRIYESKALRDDALTILEEIRADLLAGRVLLKIDRLDASNLYLRR
jgi:hypothetical protein